MKPGFGISLGSATTVFAMLAAGLMPGCVTPSRDAATKAGEPAAVASAKSQAVPAPAQVPPSSRAVPAQQRLALPERPKPSVPPVVLPPFDWQDAAIGLTNRVSVLTAIAAKPRPDEFDAMIRVTDMDGRQLAGFLAAVADRLERLDVWNSGAKGMRSDELRKRVSAAQAAGHQEELSRLVGELDLLDAEYGALRTALRARVMGVMTLAQQRVWAGHRLWGSVARGLRGVELTADQQAKALAICVEAAAELIKDGTVSEDPYLNATFQGQGELQAKTLAQVKSAVLTADQRAKLQAP